MMSLDVNTDIAKAIKDSQRPASLGSCVKNQLPTRLARQIEKSFYNGYLAGYKQGCEDTLLLAQKAFDEINEGVKRIDAKIDEAYCNTRGEDA